jgi:predicted metal-binding membrane protein
MAVVTIACWAWIAPMARDMYGPMTGSSAWMMVSVWTPKYLALLWAMWAVMMAAMMLPSTMPLVLIYQSFSRQDAEGSGRFDTAALTAGYLLVWTGFSAAATLVQLGLSRLLLLTPMMEMSSRTAIGITLLLAGTYQLTPWKGLCLHRCRSPLSFVMERWRGGPTGAFQMGLEHGVYCVGCCWALMLLLFAGGVMNLWAIVALTIFVLIEKTMPAGVHASRLFGVILVAGGIWSLIR